MKQQKRVTVKQSVGEMFRRVAVLSAVGFFYAVNGIIEALVHFGRDEEVGYDVITLG